VPNGSLRDNKWTIKDGAGFGPSGDRRYITVVPGTAKPDLRRLSAASVLLLLLHTADDQASHGLAAVAAVVAAAVGDQSKTNDTPVSWFGRTCALHTASTGSGKAHSTPLEVNNAIRRVSTTTQMERRTAEDSRASRRGRCKNSQDLKIANI